MTKKILAVDDSATIRQMLSFTLRGAGYDVVVAEDGVEGLEKAKAEQMHLVITDQNMPRMDGLSLIRSLRANPSYKSAPILVLTTESSDEMKAKGKAAGATGWMVKPFDPEKLINIVKRVLG
jgi:two-component system, chemotaxis family, chemotaxis protein CheY